MTELSSVLTIAGSDSSGGAGIEADLKTIQEHGLFGTCAITALTAQNTCGVRAVEEVSPQMVLDQISAVFDDIRPDAVKIGMVSSAAIVDVIAEALRAFGAQHVVVDPVMVATSGSALIRISRKRKRSQASRWTARMPWWKRRASSLMGHARMRASIASRPCW